MSVRQLKAAEQILSGKTPPKRSLGAKAVKKANASLQKQSEAEPKSTAQPACRPAADASLGGQSDAEPKSTAQPARQPAAKRPTAMPGCGKHVSYRGASVFEKETKFRVYVPASLALGGSACDVDRQFNDGTKRAQFGACFDKIDLVIDGPGR